MTKNAETTASRPLAVAIISVGGAAFYIILLLAASLFSWTDGNGTGFSWRQLPWLAFLIYSFLALFLLFRMAKQGYLMAMIDGALLTALCLRYLYQFLFLRGFARLDLNVLATYFFIIIFTAAALLYLYKNKQRFR